VIDLHQHLRHIRSLPCVLCGSREVIHPHHVRLAGFCGTSLLPPDFMVVPLCVICHTRVHHGYRGDERERVLEALAMLQGEILQMALSGEPVF